jgi:hypothetical protein
MRSLRILVLALMLPLAGCVVRERVVERPALPPTPCAGAVRVEGHDGAAGRWHPGFWSCPAPRAVVVVPG